MDLASRLALLLVLTGSMLAGTVGAASADPTLVPTPPGPATVIAGPGVCC